MITPSPFLPAGHLQEPQGVPPSVPQPRLLPAREFQMPQDHLASRGVGWEGGIFPGRSGEWFWLRGPAW